jgi:hypothetical protein
MQTPLSFLTRFLPHQHYLAFIALDQSVAAFKLFEHYWQNYVFLVMFWIEEYTYTCILLHQLR